MIWIVELAGREFKITIVTIVLKDLEEKKRMVESRQRIGHYKNK